MPGFIVYSKPMFLYYFLLNPFYKKLGCWHTHILDFDFYSEFLPGIKNTILIKTMILMGFHNISGFY